MKFNKFNLITTSLFVLGFVFILMNFISSWFNLVAIALFSVASVMLTILFYFSCKRKNALLSSENEEIIMELALNEELDSYVPVEKKQKKFKNFLENFRIFSPCILSGLLAVLMIVFLIASIIKL